MHDGESAQPLHWSSTFKNLVKEEQKQLIVCRDIWRLRYTAFFPVQFKHPIMWSHFTTTVVIGFHWRTEVGFSLLLSLCVAELPHCLLCLRHLLGHPTHTCHPHPRSASSFGGWGSRGAGRSSHLGRDQESRTVKSLAKYTCYSVYGSGP